MATIRRAPALTRRSVLGGIASGAVGFAVGPGCCPKPRDRDNVVIVGAGAAGIGAALTLQQAGRSYHLFEGSRDRIGGRAFTNMTTFGTPFDVGCAWMHADEPDKNSMMQKVREWKDQGKWKSETFDHGMWETHDCGRLDFNDVFYGSCGRVDRAKLQSELSVAEHKLKEAIKQKVQQGESGDVAVGRLVTDWRWPNDVAATAMGPMDAAVDLYNLSTADSYATGDYKQNVLVKNGYGRVIQLLARGVPSDRLFAGTCVTQIRSSAGGVTVTTDNGSEVEAGAVIITVSTGVLAKNAIRFWDGGRDGLPDEHRQAIENLPMGLLAKIPLPVPECVHDALLKADISDFANLLTQRSDLQNVYFLVSSYNPNLIVGFVGGDFAWSLARKVPAVPQGRQPPHEKVEKVRREALALAKDRLADLFGCDVKGQCDAAGADNGFLTDWGWNPLTHGAYAAPTPGHFKARETLREPAYKRIYFAGEAVATDGWHGTCHGAYDSGCEVANKVIAMLDKNV